MAVSLSLRGTNKASPAALPTSAAVCWGSRPQPEASSAQPACPEQSADLLSCSRDWRQRLHELWHKGGLNVSTRAWEPACMRSRSPAFQGISAVVHLLQQPCTTAPPHHVWYLRRRLQQVLLRPSSHQRVPAGQASTACGLQRTRGVCRHGCGQNRACAWLHPLAAATSILATYRTLRWRKRLPRPLWLQVLSPDASTAAQRMPAAACPCAALLHGAQACPNDPDSCSTVGKCFAMPAHLMPTHTAACCRSAMSSLWSILRVLLALLAFPWGSLHSAYGWVRSDGPVVCPLHVQVLHQCGHG